MTYTYLPADLPKRLRDAGIRVLEIPGWQTRGRPGTTGEFKPVGVLNHHTAASALGWTVRRIKAYVRWMFLVGRISDGLPPPLCQISLGRKGTVYIGAAGRANHAGEAKAVGSVAAGDGNALYVGVEWQLSGYEAIPDEMYEAGVVLNMVLLDVLGSSHRAVAAHYETSVTGKWDIGDPNGVRRGDHKVLNMERFRLAVQAASKPKPPPKKPTKVTKARVLLESAMAAAKKGSGRRRKIAEALKILPRR
jgi:hypothetical protein